MASPSRTSQDDDPQPPSIPPELAHLATAGPAYARRVSESLQAGNFAQDRRRGLLISGPQPEHQPPALVGPSIPTVESPPEPTPTPYYDAREFQSPPPAEPATAVPEALTCQSLSYPQDSTSRDTVASGYYTTVPMRLSPSSSPVEGTTGSLRHSKSARRTVKRYSMPGRLGADTPRPTTPQTDVDAVYLSEDDSASVQMATPPTIPRRSSSLQHHSNYIAPESSRSRHSYPPRATDYNDFHAKTRAAKIRAVPNPSLSPAQEWTDEESYTVFDGTKVEPIVKDSVLPIISDTHQNLQIQSAQEIRYTAAPAAQPSAPGSIPPPALSAPAPPLPPVPAPPPPTLLLTPPTPLPRPRSLGQAQPTDSGISISLPNPVPNPIPSSSTTSIASTRQAHPLYPRVTEPAPTLTAFEDVARLTAEGAYPDQATIRRVWPKPAAGLRIRGVNGSAFREEIRTPVDEESERTDLALTRVPPSAAVGPAGPAGVESSRSNVQGNVRSRFGSSLRPPRPIGREMAEGHESQEGLLMQDLDRSGQAQAQTQTQAQAQAQAQDPAGAAEERTAGCGSIRIKRLFKKVGKGVCCDKS